MWNEEEGRGKKFSGGGKCILVINFFFIWFSLFENFIF